MKPDISVPPNAAQLHTLDNGLEIILLEDHAHPLASVQLWVKAGSLHEERWTGAGLAHLVEHMFFKGTEKRTAPQISQEIQALGGYVNAYTTFNRTVYWIDGVSEHVDGYLNILADMARSSNFHAEELVKEQEVIRREFAMDNDDPQSVLQHLMQGTAFREHPLRHPIIGHLEIFNQAGRDDVVGFVRRHYVPNNCFLVIVGAFDTDTVLAKIQEHFGTWERRPYEPVLMPEEPVQVAPRHMEKEFNTDIARVSLGWPIGGESHPDKPVLDVLGFILGSGRSSRLNRELRERLGIAHWVGAGAWSALDRGLFAVEAECDAEDLEQVEAELAKVLDGICETGPTQEELDKAVRATLSHQLRLRSTTRGMANSLGHSWLTVGNLDQDRTYLERVRTLTIADLVGAAKTYILPHRRCRVSLHPQGTLKKASRNGVKTSREEAQRFELSNGMTLLVGENPRLPLVSTRIQFLAGVPVETENNAGVTQITAQWLVKGTQKRTDEQIAAVLEDRGGSLQSTGDAHRLVLGADVVKGDEVLALDLLAEVLTEPLFPADHLPKMKKRQQASLREELEDPLTVALRRARREMFAGLPFARTALGTQTSVSNLDEEICRAHWQQTVQGRNGVISVFGDVKAVEVLAMVEARLGSIPAGDKSRAGFAPETPTAEASRWDLKLDKEQGVLVIGFPTVGLHDTHAAALQLIDEACSDMGSRLFNRIREEMGLAYYVGTQSFHALGCGAFYFYVGTDPKKLELVESELMKEIASLAQAGLASDELQRAKTTWKSSWLRQQQGNGAMADALGWDELNGFGFGHHKRLPEIVEAVTDKQIQETASRFFDPARAFVVTVRP
ncbi:MAG TPA: pitrilysin family protein [Verrucomicrobium sp.]|nr:pitrilysin family protein [Verrucomicrobium sp.]